MIKKITFIAIIFIAVSVISFSRWLSQSGPLLEPVVIDIKKGSNLNAIATLLNEKGVIRSPLLFKIKSKINNSAGKIKAGEYQFEPHVSTSQVLEKIIKGDVVYHQITIPEGKTTVEILEILKKHPKLSGEITIEVKEGELLPETYTITSNTSRDYLVKQMKNNMQKALDKAWNNKPINAYIKSKKDALILASIIEKETSIDNERALVSSVFINRLKKGMRLQTDPTVIYAITKGKHTLKRKLYRKDLKIKSPYNTYRVYGLPPAPICNPGEESIKAALNPAQSDYYYFVASGNGGHNFGKTLKEHNQNVFKWKKKLKQQKN